MLYITLQIYVRPADRHLSVLMCSLEKNYIHVLCVDIDIKMTCLFAILAYICREM